MRLVRNLNIGKKIALIVLAMLAPIVLLATLYGLDRLGDLDHVDSQRGGIPYLVEARTLMQALAEHRAYANIVQRNGTAEADSRATGARERIDRSLKVLEDRLAEDGDRYGLAGDVAAIGQAWRELQSNWRNRAPQDVIRAHTAVIQQVYALFPLVGQRSSLMLDADPGTYYIMDTAVVRVPSVVNGLLDARAIAVLVAGEEQKSSALRDEVVRTMGDVRKEIRHLDVSADALADFAPEYGQQVHGLIAQLNEATARFDELAMRAAEATVDPDLVRAAAARAIDKGYEIFDVSMPALQASFDAHIV
jgi:methyl-accepting chemotaxis protein